MSDPRRASDRWVTPPVVIVGILAVTGLVALVLLAVAYLQLRGIDPSPTIRLVMEATGNASAFVVLLLTLVKRRTDTKIERNTGQLAAEVRDIADKVYEDPHQPVPLVTSQARGAHAAATGKLPPVPPARC